jgi:hypothetical protein
VVGQAALKKALMEPEGIPLALLSSAERKGVSVLTQHALVTVDGKGLGAMHALTQAAVRELTDQAERLRLATVVTEALDEKLGKIDIMKPATHFIGRRYGRHAMAVGGHAREWGLVPAQGDAKWRGGAGVGEGGVRLESLGRICTRAGHFFQAVDGQYGQAEGMYEMSLACDVARYGYAHANTAVSYNNLGQA